MQRAAISQPPAPHLVHTGEGPTAHSHVQQSAPPQFAHQPPSFTQRPPVQEPPQVSHAAQPAPKPQSEFGLDGHCPVSLVDQLHLPAEQQRWIKGDPRWGAVHRGRTYLFAGPEQQQRFLASPDLYSPALSGNDPILSFTRGVPVPGQRAFGVAYNNRMYLFASEDTLKQFWEAPDHYAATVLQAEQPTQSRLR
jgi:protein disulfide-isomerase